MAMPTDILGATDWTDAVLAVSAALQAVAFLTAGFWAYLKFTSGGHGLRRERLELKVDGSFYQHGRDGEHILIVIVTVRNLGLSPVDLDPSTPATLEVKGLIATEGRDDTKGPPKSFPPRGILEGKSTVRAQETITDGKPIRIPSDELPDVAAFELKVRVNGKASASRLIHARRGDQRKPREKTAGRYWEAEAIVSLAEHARS